MQVPERSLRIRVGVNAQPVPYPFLKRMTDKVLSGLLLVFLAPVFVFVSGAIGLDMLLSRHDRGPWLYRERRISRGREFPLLKFRVLRQGALGRAEGHSRLLEDDAENLTWAGRRILKPWYLDELPQLVNILRGEMSLVGPRPWPVSVAREQAATGLDYRDRVIAGWTGPAQVRKGLVETAHYTELDLAYVEACQTWPTMRLVRYDLALLWKTVKLMVRGEGLEF